MGDDKYFGQNSPPLQFNPPSHTTFDPELWVILREMVCTCCDLLDPIDAEIIRRAHMEAQSRARIAKATGMSETAIGKRQVAARRKLFALMTQPLSPNTHR